MLAITKAAESSSEPTVELVLSYGGIVAEHFSAHPGGGLGGI
jgi:hypothetical protein